MSAYYEHEVETTVYGKHNLQDEEFVKNLYLKGVTRVKLARGGYYDVFYSSSAGYHTRKSPLQYDIKKDPIYLVEYIDYREVM